MGPMAELMCLPAGAFFEIRAGKVARIGKTENLNGWIAQVGA
jgi:hypothetical protein